MCVWAGIPSTVEVFGAFQHLIPAEGLSRIERGRVRQVMVPDMKLVLPHPTGGKITSFAEIKTIGCREDLYKPLGECAVRRR